MHLDSQYQKPKQLLTFLQISMRSPKLPDFQHLPYFRFLLLLFCLLGQSIQYLSIFYLYFKCVQKQCQSKSNLFFLFPNTSTINSMQSFLLQIIFSPRFVKERIELLKVPHHVKSKFMDMRLYQFISVAFIHHLCMQKPQRNYKVKQEQRESNPIYNIVAKKIHNINKKLSQLSQLQSTEKRAPTQAQLAKIAKREELARQLAKQEEFLSYYKQLVVENNLIYDKVDDLIKLSTLITVGKRVQRERYCPEETKEIYNQIYSQIFSKTVYNGKNQLSDEIIRVYRLLEAYLENQKYYSQCKDYMSYSQEIELRKPKNESLTSDIIQHVQPISSLLKGKQALQNDLRIDEKTRKLAITKQVFHFKQESSRISQRIQEIQSQIKTHLQQKQLIVTYTECQKNSESESTLPDLEARRKDSYNEMITQKPGDFIKKAQERENNSEEKSKQTPNPSKRKTKNKKNNYVQVFEGDSMRKSSEIISEAASETPKPKKARYVEKVQ